MNNTSTNSTDFDFDSQDNRNGKIARLPRPLRERINRALYDRCTAKHLVKILNEMPEVKAVLAQYFGGRPILTQNIYEWKNGGYRDWLRRQQVLEQKRELAADAKDLADTANNMADSLFGLVTIDYAHLMMNRDKEDPEQYEKKRKSLSILSQDIVRLRRCHLNARRVQVQETKLDNDKEKTEEQLHFKFMTWAENPDIRKALILAPLEADRRMRILWDLPPAPEDPLVEKETKDDPYFGHFAGKQTKTKPNQTGNSDNGTGVPPVSDPSPASDKTPESKDHSSQPTASPSPALEQKPEDTVGPSSNSAGQDTLSQRERDGVRENGSIKNPATEHAQNDTVDRTTHASSSAAAADQQVSPNTTQDSLPDIKSLYGDKKTNEIIQEIEENYAREQAARNGVKLDHSNRNPTSTQSDSRLNSKLNTQNSSLHKPNPFDTFSEPVHYSHYSSNVVPPLRPPPGFNSLG